MAARIGYRAAERGFAWSVRASDDAGIVFRRVALARATILSARMAELAAPTHRRATIAFTRVRHHALAQARRLEARLTISVVRAAQDTQRLLERYTQGGGARKGRALIVRPNTALACIEPMRAHLPVIRARELNGRGKGDVRP